MNESFHASIPINRRCQILKKDPTGIYAINKPEGIQTHPNNEKSKVQNNKTLLNADYSFNEECYQWENEKKEKQKIYLTHRLDAPTSGVIIIVDNMEFSSQIKQMFRERKIKKSYYALVKLNNRIKPGIWKDNLKEVKNNGRIRVRRGNGNPAITQVSVERQPSGKFGLAMLKMEPLTGRTHQLRVQCALRGMPVIGDKSYGDFSLNRKIAKISKINRLCLHAGGIEFNIKTKRNDSFFSFESPLPREFGKLLI